MNNINCEAPGSRGSVELTLAKETVKFCITRLAPVTEMFPALFMVAFQVAPEGRNGGTGPRRDVRRTLGFDGSTGAVVTVWYPVE